MAGRGGIVGTCLRKARHESRESAERERQWILKRAAPQDKNIVKVYTCVYCGCFHCGRNVRRRCVKELKGAR